MINKLFASKKFDFSDGSNEKQKSANILHGTGSGELKRSQKSFEKVKKRKPEEKKGATTIEDALSLAGVASPHRPDELQKHIFSTQQSSGLLSPV